ncbi:hypothetical protein GWE18_40695 [Bradyrhizobium sp. CSA112]|uniref:SctD/MshK family protein n=1 Tax=Bradyrhizobium sp. CSA112 TaxID=2699170 RepID=UPI0023B0D64D|nr:hypothetical protein [Bradyrhizobium sp. CSA112]MDE5458934.1 hypothetical protein [Bradyrhizobium sp. CSA112]
MNEPASVDFEVLSGLYSGVTGEAPVGTSLIGSGLDADIVFVEQGLEPNHFRLTPLHDSMEIEALAAGVSIEGNGDIAVGKRVVISLPAVVHAGTMSIRCTQESEQGSIGLSRVSIIAAALVLLSSVGIATLAVSFLFDGSAGALSPDAPPVAALPPKLTLNGPDDRPLHAAAEQLQEEVNKAGLLNIKIGPGPGVVSAEGTVTPASVSRWQKVQQWFDQHTNGSLTLVNGVIVKEDKPPSSIAVQAVWRGAHPYLLIGGQKYFVGALLNDGWTVDRIEAGSVLLSRNGRLAALPY